MAVQGLVDGPLSESCLHLCADMQRLFGPGYPWAVPWLEGSCPAIGALCAWHPARTVFTLHPSGSGSRSIDAAVDGG